MGSSRITAINKEEPNDTLPVERSQSRRRVSDCGGMAAWRRSGGMGAATAAAGPGGTCLDRDDGTDAAIARMAGLLKLIERITTLEQKEKALARAKKPPRVVNDARRLELARRLENLRRQLEAEGDHQASEG